MRLTPLRLTVVYGVIAAVWIAFSDAVVADLPGGLQQQINTLKGWAFVAATGYIIYVLSVSLQRTASEGRSAALAAEEQARRLAHSLALALTAERAVVRSLSETELFQTICDALIADGRFSCAWVETTTDDGSMLLATAAGACPRGAGPETSGLAATALAQGRTVREDQVADGRQIALWDEPGTGNAGRSSGSHLEEMAAIAVPIGDAGGSLGVLTLHHAQAGSIDEETVRELERVAADAAYAVRALRARIERDRAIRAEQAAAAQLQLASQRFERLLTAAPVSIVVMDPSGRVLSWNPGAEQLWGVPAAEAIGSFAPWAPSPQDEAFRSLMQATIEQGSITGATRARTRRDGREIAVQVSTACVQGASGETEVLAIQQDVTDQVAAELALKRSLARLQVLRDLNAELLGASSSADACRVALSHVSALVPSARTSVLLFDLDAETVAVAAAAGEIGGAGLPVGTVLPISAVLPGGLAAEPEVRIFTADQVSETTPPPIRALAERGVTTVAYVPVVDAGGSIGALILAGTAEQPLPHDAPDVTAPIADRLAIAIRQTRDHEEMARYAASLELVQSLDRAILGASDPAAFARESASRALALLKADLVFIAEYDVTRGLGIGRIVEGTIKGMVRSGESYPLTRSFTPDFIAAPTEVITNDLASGETTQPFLAYTRESGVRSLIYRPFIADGLLIGALGLGWREPNMIDDRIRRDADAIGARVAISLQQSRMRRDIAEREARLAAILEVSPSPMLLVDGEGKIQYANLVAGDAFRCPRADLVGRSIGDFVPKLVRRRGASQTPRLSIPVRQGGMNVEALRSNGSTFPAMALLAQMDPTTDARTVVSIVDLSDREALERQLRQSQKMEAMGHFAGILAHDVRTYFTAIQWAAEMLAEDLGPGDPRQVDVTSIREAVEGGRALVQRVLEFARPTPGQAQETDLATHVHSLAGILSRMMGASIECDLDVPGGLPSVGLEPAAATQILLNLATNARDAMPDGGTFRIEAGLFELPEAAIRPDGQEPELPPGRYVRLVVSDTGTGMDETTARLAFDPFFSTKLDDGSTDGTGLGLTSVAMIVQRAGGRVAVESEPGRGTTFTIDLPALP